MRTKKNNRSNRRSNRKSARTKSTQTSHERYREADKFRESMLGWFPVYTIESLEEVLDRKISLNEYKNFVWGLAKGFENLCQDAIDTLTNSGEND